VFFEHACTCVKGLVHGGQQPVTGAQVYLYATGITGYGAASSSLLTTPGGYVTNDANGDFDITNDYICSSSVAERTDSLPGAVVEVVSSLNMVMAHTQLGNNNAYCQ
jgi:hypothetical protein